MGVMPYFNKLSLMEYVENRNLGGGGGVGRFGCLETH